MTYAAAVVTGTVATLLLLTHAAWPAWIAVGAAATVGTVFTLRLERVFERELLVRTGSVTEVRRTARFPRPSPLQGSTRFRRAS